MTHKPTTGTVEICTDRTYHDDVRSKQESDATQNKVPPSTHQESAVPQLENQEGNTGVASSSGKIKAGYIFTRKRYNRQLVVSLTSSDWNEPQDTFLVYRAPKAPLQESINYSRWLAGSRSKLAFASWKDNSCWLDGFFEEFVDIYTTYVQNQESVLSNLSPNGVFSCIHSVMESFNLNASSPNTIRTTAKIQFHRSICKQLNMTYRDTGYSTWIFRLLNAENASLQRALFVTAELHHPACEVIRCEKWVSIGNEQLDGFNTDEYPYIIKVTSEHLGIVLESKCWKTECSASDISSTAPFFLLDLCGIENFHVHLPISFTSRRQGSFQLRFVYCAQQKTGYHFVSFHNRGSLGIYYYDAMVPSYRPALLKGWPSVFSFPTVAIYERCSSLPNYEPNSFEFLLGMF